ncbi:8-oxo-dGTP diphosphatase [Antricoccus suffuscus]|uniref:8-oxo-dGTP diphosphatase n=1 Tax=Antricoccus suffuscus TaxID=1629062 RepID=A0A2T1A4G1_9ACTN|nr:NUDIX hydrolase [Antricoccus suffuscus]PRZ43485.1 8-oxo-dGTP diphosphatase [Antricoccus suffuscus]
MSEPDPVAIGDDAAKLTAAGGVLWRDTNGTVEVLLVHRPSYDDWSLPKGKPDASENPIQTAVREVTEETGLPFTLGVFLSTVHYRVGSHAKSVSYWAMRLTDGCADAPASVDVEEIDDFTWVPLAKASGVLTYPTDRAVLDRFAQIGTTPIALLLVRHGRAGERNKWTGDDYDRPLDKKGRRQATAIAQTLPAFAPISVYTADPVRCRQTVQPLAEALQIKVKDAPNLGDIEFAEDDERGFGEVHKLLTAPGPVVLSTQGGVVDALTSAFRVDHNPAQVGSKKGGVWAFGGVGDQIVTADYYRTLQPGDE